MSANTMTPTHPPALSDERLQGIRTMCSHRLASAGDVPALLSHIDHLTRELAAARVDATNLAREKEALEKALEDIEKRWTGARRHHDCGDYERGYGQAEADIGQFARAALATSRGKP